MPTASHIAGDRNDLGIDRVLVGDRQQVRRMSESGGAQGAFRLRVADDHRYAPSAALIDQRVCRIELDDDHGAGQPPGITPKRLVQVCRNPVPLGCYILTQVVDEYICNVSKTAHHDVIRHERNADLLRPIPKERREGSQRGVSGHSG
nr:hypothetical protein [Mycobacterium sp. EPa45]